MCHKINWCSNFDFYRQFNDFLNNFCAQFFLINFIILPFKFEPIFLFPDGLRNFIAF